MEMTGGIFLAKNRDGNVASGNLFHVALQTGVKKNAASSKKV